MFLDLQLAGSTVGWRVRQTSVGELMSVLYGPCSDTKKVVLDPVPEVGGEEMTELLSMHRNDFLRFLLGEEVPSKLHFVPPSNLQTPRVSGEWARRITSSRLADVRLYFATSSPSKEAEARHSRYLSSNAAKTVQ
jgi:hypothetical protein